MDTLGGVYFWLGASADADRAAHEPSQSSLSRPIGEHPSRYSVGELPISNSYAAVFDAARNGECFCLIDPNECVGGLPTALARAKDIAAIFNKAERR